MQAAATLQLDITQARARRRRSGIGTKNASRGTFLACVATIILWPVGQKRRACRFFRRRRHFQGRPRRFLRILRYFWGSSHCLFAPPSARKAPPAALEVPRLPLYLLPGALVAARVPLEAGCVPLFLAALGQSRDAFRRFLVGAAGVILAASGRLVRALTDRTTRSRFSARLNSGIRHRITSCARLH